MKWKSVIIAAALMACTVGFTASPAHAWNCPTGQHRVQAPKGTPTSTPFYDVVEGIAFICEPDVPTAPPSSSTQSQNQNQNQTQNQNQNQTATATGGSSTATGGSSVLKNAGNSQSSSSAQGGSVNGSGNSSQNNSGNSTLDSSISNKNTSVSGVKNSGNSSVNSTTSSASSATNNGNGNGNNSNNYSEQYNEVRQNPGAYAPSIFNTSPCTKGFSGGASTPAFAATLGLSTTDKGCDSRQTAVIFHGLGNDYAAAKVICSTDASKRAHLSLDDCLRIVIPVPVVIPAPVVPQPTIIVIPTPAPVAAIAPPVQIAVPVKAFGTLTEIGDCKLANGRITNVCNRFLDDAIIRLNNLPNAKLRVTGPIESTQAIKYLKARVSPSRVEYVFSDDQNATINFELWSVE